VWVARGELDHARDRALRALGLELGGKDRLAAEGYHILGLIDAIRAHWVSAGQRFEQALAVREHVWDGPGMTEGFVELGRVRQYQGDWPGARVLYERAVAVADQMEPCPYQIQAHRAHGRFLLLAGDEEDAATQLQTAMVLAQAMPETFEFAPTLVALAELRFVQGDLQSAADLAQRGLEHPENWFVDQFIEGQVVFATIQLARGELSTAASLAAEALNAAGRLQAPRLMSVAALAGARVAAEGYDWAAALKGFEAALDHATRAETPYERASAMEGYARALTAARRDAGLAATLQHEAERLFRELVATQPERRQRTAIGAAS
jgi:ATP/maltotriose-dependent transcriptional regulator MalT